MKIKKFGATEQIVFDLVRNAAEDQGVRIWDIRFEKEGASWYLRIFIDKDGGIGIEDCENLTRPVNKLLDEADPISQSYILEVGSAGLEREIIRESHFEAAIGLPVRVRAIRDFNGEKEIVGILTGFDKEKIIITLPSEAEGGDDFNNELSLKDIAYIRLFEDYEDLL